MIGARAASVAAFRVLSRELSAHGAPRRLVRSAARAARDEFRHARLTARLARLHGATPLRPSVAPRPLRTLEEVALENAVEGCVRETYGALLAMWQARHAQDRSIARAMAHIVKDETRHAALSWAVAAWALPRLGPAPRARIDAAHRPAIATLRSEIQTPLAPELISAAGMPAVDAALRLLAQRLWQS